MRWSRSIRARLVATYTVVAMFLAVAGLFLFAVLLRRGSMASVDAGLRARAAPIIATVNARSTPTGSAGLKPGPALPKVGGVDRPDGPNGSPGSTSGRSDTSVDAFTALYGPKDQVVGLQPAELRSSPLTRAQLRTARSRVAHFRLQLGDEEVRVLAFPVRTAVGTWVVAAGASLGPFASATNEAIHELELAVPALIVLAALSAWLLSGAALRPIERMRADADALGQHDPASRLSVPATADNLAKLAVTFNALLDRLHRSLARQRDLIADAGHELRTPLSVLRIELELADDTGASRDELADAITHARNELERLSRLAEDLLFLARADSASRLVQLEETDVSILVAESVRASRGRATALAVEITMDVAGPCITHADPVALRRALDNIVANALAASPLEGTVEVRGWETVDGVTIVVSDDGPGFPDTFLGHAFERFARPDGHRTSGAGGAGLGLAIVAEIVHAHHGNVTATNLESGGAAVTIILPPRPAQPSHRTGQRVKEGHAVSDRQLTPRSTPSRALIQQDLLSYLKVSVIVRPGVPGLTST